MRNARTWGLLALAAAHLGLGAWAVREYSATFDEPMHVAAGYAALARGDLRLDPNNPPLAKLWQALPLLALGVRAPWDGPEFRGGFHYAFGERLLYWSGNNGDRLLFAARSMNLLLSAALVLLLGFWARRRWGDLAGLSAAAAAAFSPSLLAHGALATNDLSMTLFATAATLAAADYAEQGRREQAWAAGLAAAAAALCKLSGALLVPVFLLIVPRRRWREAALWVPLGAILLLHHEALFERARQVAAGGHPVFVLGKNRPEGWLGTYVVTLLAKATFFELAVLGAGLWLWRKKKERAALALAGVFFLAATLSKKQIGLRYMLPVFPALALEAGWLVSRFPRAAWLILLQAGAALGAAPDFLPYFNAAARPWERRLLGDSNLDWGQDLRRLGRWWRENGEPEIILSYFGTASADYHGLKAQHVLTHSSIRRHRLNSKAPQKEYLAVSVTNLQETYAPGMGWLRERTPAAQLGRGLLLYDIGADAAAHERLSELYARAGQADLARRERDRAVALRR